MTSRFEELDRLYQFRSMVSLVLAGLVLAAILYLTPAERLSALRDARLAQRGPLRILPQLDIIPEEESPRRLTAAPVSVTPADFVALDIVYRTRVTENPVEPVPPPVPQLARQDPFDFPTVDDLRQAVRTTGLPVPARSELVVLHVERPVYPRQAVDLNIQGTVELMLLVDAGGKVSQVFVVNPNRHPFLERSAVEAAHRFLFGPYLVRGKPTPFWVRLPFVFRLIR